MASAASESLKLTALRALQLMDLTSLNEDDTEEKIATLCRQANSRAGKVAAVCVYPRFVALAKKILQEQGAPEILVATVTNFPNGGDDPELAAAETRAAIAYGADEVDVVFPYRALLTGNAAVGATLVAACKQACGEKTLKVIIESGELKAPELIREASRIAIDAGADFIKTSTGKVALNATPEAAAVMLGVIAETGGRCGFKAAGGVRSAADAAAYLALADNLLENTWATPVHFRFGASSLLDSLLRTIDGDVAAGITNGY